MSNFPSSEDSDGTSEAQFTLPNAADELRILNGVHYVMPPALEAFCDLYGRPHLRYAHTVLGDERAAKAVVQRCYSHLALNWAIVLKEASPEAYAWRLLKQRVELHLRITGSTQGSSPSTLPDVRTAAMQRAARAMLEALRRELEAMESALGLYTAIAALPERQYDVRTTTVFELSDEFLLLGVHADHGLAGVPVLARLLVEIAELGVAVWVLAALDGLGVGLQAEAFLPQQSRDGVGADLVPGPGQLTGEGPG